MASLQEHPLNKLVVVASLVCAGLLVGCKGDKATGTPPDGQVPFQPGPVQPGPVQLGPVQPGPITVVPMGGNNPPIARIAGRTINERQLRDPLIDAYGLNMLLNLVQYELAAREAERAQVTVTEVDVASERQMTIDRMFAQSNAQNLATIETLRATDATTADKMLADLRKDNEASLDQLLAQQRISRPEFDLVIRTNAIMTKLVEPQVSAAITDNKLQESFRVQYGEKVVVRHIQTNNLTELNSARRRLANGEAFEAVAKDMSTNRATAPLGGEVPSFTRSNTSFPQSFRDAAFALKVGEVSEAVQSEGSFHLIKLEQRIDPTVVKFEDVKEAVRIDLHDKLLQAAIRNLRQQIGQEAMAGLTIEDPILKKQFDERLEQQQAKVRDRDSIREDLNRQRDAIAAQQAADLAALATAQAASQPVTATATTTSTVTTAPVATSMPAVTVPPAPSATTKATTTSDPAKSFVDDLFPSTLPKPMKSALPDDLPATQPVGAPIMP